MTSSLCQSQGQEGQLGQQVVLRPPIIRRRISANNNPPLLPMPISIPRPLSPSNNNNNTNSSLVISSSSVGSRPRLGSSGGHSSGVSSARSSQSQSDYSRPPTPSRTFIIFTERVDPQEPEPNPQDVEEFARRIGIEPQHELNLLPIARDGLRAYLPPNWKPCFDSTRSCWFYLETRTGYTQWEHPMDEVYRQKVASARAATALNRIATFDPKNQKPPTKSLPPLNKPPTSKNSNLNPQITKTNPAPSSESLEWALEKERQIENQQQQNLKSNFPPSQKVKPINNTANTTTITSSNSQSKENDQTGQFVPPPTRKPLALTGSGASFLKSTSSATSLLPGDVEPGTTHRDLQKEVKKTEPEVEAQKPKPAPTAANDVNDQKETGSGLQTDKTTRVVQKSSGSGSSIINSFPLVPKKSAASTTTVPKKPIEPKNKKTEEKGAGWNFDPKNLNGGEEKKVWENLNSSSPEVDARKPAGSVKFNLDENSEIRFEDDWEEVSSPSPTAEEEDSADVVLEKSADQKPIRNSTNNNNNIAGAGDGKPSNQKPTPIPITNTVQKTTTTSQNLKKSSTKTGSSTTMSSRQKSELVMTKKIEPPTPFISAKTNAAATQQQQQQQPPPTVVSMMVKEGEVRGDWEKRLQALDQEFRKKVLEKQQNLRNEFEVFEKGLKAERGERLSRLEAQKADLEKFESDQLQKLKARRDDLNKKFQESMIGIEKELAEAGVERGRVLREQQSAEAAEEIRKLKEGQRGQLEQMRDYHASFLAKTSAIHLHEVNELKRIHEVELAAIKSSHEAKLDQIRTQNEAQLIQLQQEKAKSNHILNNNNTISSTSTSPVLIVNSPRPSKSARPEVTSKKIDLDGDYSEMEKVKVKLFEMEEKYSHLKRDLQLVVSNEINKKLGKLPTTIQNSQSSTRNEVRPPPIDSKNEKNGVDWAAEGECEGSSVSTVGDEEDPFDGSISLISGGVGLNIEEMMKGNELRLSQALSSLDTLREQIVHLKHNKLNQNHNVKKVGPLKKTTKKSMEEVKKFRPSRSTESLVINNHGEGHNTLTTTSTSLRVGEDYVAEAKSFIRAQKARLQHLAIGQQHQQQKQQKYQNQQLHQNNSEETESSGLGSLKTSIKALQEDLGGGNEVVGTDEVGLNEDIESILSSLRKLDGQMAHLWAVVRPPAKVPVLGHDRSLPPSPTSRRRRCSGPTGHTGGNGPLLNILDRNYPKPHLNLNMVNGHGHAGSEALALTTKTKHLRDWLQKIS